MSQSIDPWVSAWSTENTDDSFEGGNTTCPKCGAETKLMRLEKSPDFMGEIRVYECSNCSRKNLVIVPDCQGRSRDQN
jgi:C4-type Zn-finger protein